MVAGIPSADYLLDSLTPQQWHEIQALDCVEPIGWRGAEMILARIGELLAAFVGSEMRAADFAPWLPRPKEKPLTVGQSRDAITAHLQRLTGGT
jgi:hypothetical protein